MKHKQLFTLVLPLAIFIGVMFFLWVGLHHNPREIPSPLIDKPVPEFRAETLANPQQMLTQQMFQGHVTVLNVFASWCSSCLAEHMILMEAFADLNKQTQVIGLDFKDDRDKALTMLDEYGDPYHQVIFDPQGTIGINFGVYGTPETFIIDKQGIIRYKFIGAINAAAWKNTLVPKIKQWEQIQ